uniref:Uncharacterized protein n=1 Tax=Arundo donax TaxID=35708 RepID=A0A0A9B560_ARUDO
MKKLQNSSLLILKCSGII